MTAEAADAGGVSFPSFLVNAAGIVVAAIAVELERSEPALSYQSTATRKFAMAALSLRAHSRSMYDCPTLPRPRREPTSEANSTLAGSLSAYVPSYTCDVSSTGT